MKIAQAHLLVNDQDAAKAFYTEVLGLEVETDYAAGDFRWLSLRAPGPDGGASLVLGRAEGAGLAYQQEVLAADMPAFSITLTGGAAEFERIRARGAMVVMEPTRQQYGGTDALIDDTVGNIICLHQD
ncbi:VOC family protein [Citricoccus sp. I39-566]|uniref:VOC family protein n=1 Tax=Citricoccus sp. I39-566 TaxID=3073268 RepID=UPI00286CF86F|nr:VOC family protein [Citricoccus sp. I39-566]WMY78781.1 VOC family protein [Citricoccus sp. I39-566]